MFAALVTQHEMRCSVFSSIACPALPYFSTLSRKMHDFRIKAIGHTVCVCVIWFCLEILSETFLILRRTEWYITTNVHRSAYNLPVIIAKFYWNLNFLYRFSRKKLLSNKFHENSSSGSRFIPRGWTDRQTDRYEEVVFRNFQTLLQSAIRFPGALFFEETPKFYNTVRTSLPLCMAWITQTFVDGIKTYKF